MLIEGPPGIGKTTLAAELREAASARSLEVLAARGGEIERELTFGIARQLFESYFVRAGRTQRARLTQGPAASGLAGLGLSEPAGQPPVDEASIVHGLFWLLSNLLDERTAVLIVDDAHWADPASLRWLQYTLRRIEELPLLVVVALRTQEPTSDTRLLDAIRNEASLVLRPPPLSEEAVARLVRDGYRADADEAFCAACHAATGGNPFLARELVRAVEEDEIEPTAVSAELVREVHPDSIDRAVLGRLGRLDDVAIGLAHAVAVLGARAELRQAAAVAGLDLDAASEAADELARAGILEDRRPLAFVHPIMRSVVYGELSAGARSRAHSAAAAILSDDGAPPDAIATHLLAVEPAANERVVETLRSASAATRTPELKARYLKRALREPPPPELRAALLLELGEAEVAALDADAVPHLREALEMAGTHEFRLRAAKALGFALYLTGDPEDGRRVLEDAITSIATADPAGTLGLEAERVAIDDLRLPREELDRLRRLAAPGETSAERELLAGVAYNLALGRGTASEAADLARIALAQVTDGEMAAARPFYNAVWSLEFSDELGMAERWLAKAQEVARARGSVTDLAFATTFRGVVRYRSGALADARSELETATELVPEQEFAFIRPVAAAILALIEIEQGRPDAPREILLATDLEPQGRSPASRRIRVRATLSSDALVPLARGRRWLAIREPEHALREFEQAGAMMTEGGHDHPAYYSWRAPAALAHRALGDEVAARALLAEELKRARSFGAHRPIGIALLSAGHVEGGRKGIGLLSEAVAELGDSPDRLEHARALLELGAALRRANERARARELLEQAAELARQASATVVEERAREELASLGVRLPREQVAGFDALTASELRVARLAAEGLTNKEIAQELFVTVKTVEAHLRKVFIKLEVAKRGELKDALDEGALERSSKAGA